MRVALIPPPTLQGYSGSRIYGRDLATALARGGHDTHVFVNRAITLPGVTMHKLDTRLPHPIEEDLSIASEVFAAEAAGIASAVIAQHGSTPFDVVHSFYSSFTAVGGGVAARVTGIPHLVSCFGRDVNPGMSSHPAHTGLARAGLALADGAVVATSAVAAQVRRIAPGLAAVLELPMGFDTTAFASARRGATPPGFPATAGPVVTLLFSSLLPEKNVGPVVTALVPMLRDRPDTTLVLLGPHYDGGTGEADRITSLISHVGLGGRIHQAGRRPHEEIPAWLARTSLAVDARTVANFSSSALEAVAAGLPCLFSTALAAQFESDGEPPCRWIDPANPTGIATQVARVLEDNELREQLQGLAHRWWQLNGQRYCIDAAVDALGVFYAQLGSAHTQPEESP